MSKVFFVLGYPIRLICYGLIYFYKILISPLFRPSCRFKPSCSTYMLQAISEWGIINGIMLGTARICRCNPWNKHTGVDPVPTNPKGVHKWIF